jgi:hypothetical protein
VGKTAADKKLYAVRHANPIATAALVSCGGKAGKEAAHKTVVQALRIIAQQASHNNYEAVAQYFSGRLGAPFTVSNRGSFKALPDRMDDMVKAIKSGKNGGMSEKDGVQVPGAKLKLALELYGCAVNLVAEAEVLYQARMAEKNARNAELVG